MIESCGPNHVLLDGRILVDLEKRSHIWSYFGPSVSAGGPDGRHWYVAGFMNQNAALTPLALPEPKVNRVVAMVSDPSVTPSLRVGMQASVQLELSGPPKNNDKYRKAITDELNAKLKANGLTPNAGAPARFVVHVEEKNTGKSVAYNELGDAHFTSPRGTIALTNLVCDVYFDDGRGRIPLAPQQTYAMLQGFRRIYRLPPGETFESYLKGNQWNAVQILREWHRPAVLRRPTGRRGCDATGNDRPERGAVDVLARLRAVSYRAEFLTVTSFPLLRIYLILSSLLGMSMTSSPSFKPSPS